MAIGSQDMRLAVMRVLAHIPSDGCVRDAPLRLRHGPLGPPPPSARAGCSTGWWHTTRPITLALALLAASPALSAAVPPLSAAPAHTMLLDLTPTAAEFGMVKDAAGISTMEGPGAFDTAPHGNWNNAQSFWPDKLKIVRTVDPDFELPEDMDYSSSMTNLFGVEGECLTGVGLWSKVRNMYHWVAYAIPAGSTRFRANLYVTDDPDGWARPMSPGPDHKNQQFEFTVDVDGQEVLKSPHQRLSLVLGSGTKLADINIPLPAGAQTIRFRVLNSAWGDGNSNTELVIHDGVFER